MDTEEIQLRKDTNRSGRLSVSSAIVTGAAAATLARWSIWWPHADNRQRWATYLLVAVSFITLWSLTRSLAAQAPRTKIAVIVAWIAAVAIGATLGFAWLRSATLPYR